MGWTIGKFPEGAPGRPGEGNKGFFIIKAKQDDQGEEIEPPARHEDDQQADPAARFTGASSGSSCAGAFPTSAGGSGAAGAAVFFLAVLAFGCAGRGDDPADGGADREADGGADDVQDDAADDTQPADDSSDDSADDTADDSADDTVEEPYIYGIKTDNMPYADVIDALPYFVDHGLEMVLNVRPPNMEGDELVNLLAEAESRGVPVRLWPLLNSSDGSWGCEDDADLFIENVLAAVNLIANAEHNVQTVVLNMELGHPKIDLLHQYFEQGDWAAILDLLLDNRDPVLFAESTAKFRDLAEGLHAMGFKVQLGTYPLFLDDYPDGDPDLQDTSDVPVSGIGWDVESYHPYTTEYSGYLGMPIGPYFVYSYALSARDWAGANAEIAVGIVPDASDEGYGDLEAFKADIAAAKAAGVHRLAVYHLPGFLAQDDPDAWFAALDTPPAIPETQQVVDLLRALTRLADLVLDSVP